jgi:hypothetical protein
MLHRSFAVAATTALVVGAGTVTIVAPWRGHAQPAAPTTVAVTSPSADFPPQVVKLLQAAWPVKGQTISWDPASARVHDAYWQKLAYKVTSAAGSYNFEVVIFLDKKSVDSLPVSTYVDSAENFGVAYLQQGASTAAVTISYDGDIKALSESELKRLASPGTMRALYRLGIEYGMAADPSKVP